MVKVGMSKIDLEPALQAGFPIREERVEAIALYVESKAQAAVWVVLDFMDFDLASVETIQTSVCRHTGLAAEYVHVVTTHNHGGGVPDFEKLGELAASCASKARKSAVAAQMRYAITSVDRQVSIHRRKFVPELDGVTTLFYGANGEEGFDGAPFVERALHAIKDGYVCYYGREETKREYDPFDSGDREIFAIQFQGVDGTTIGTVLRFAAHAVCSNLSDSLSSDYPWYVRETLEARFGGVGLFLNGPCGDIAPEVIRKADGSQCILGEYLADTAIEALQKKSFAKITEFQDVQERITLPVRAEVQQNCVDLSEACPGMENLPARRKYLEKEYLEKQLSFLRSKAAERNGVGDTVTVSLGLMKLNELVIAAFPGETFWATGTALKAAFPEKEICTVTEHGRTVMYLPPLEDYRQGGNETVCMSTGAGAEAVLRENSIAAVKSLFYKGT